MKQNFLHVDMDAFYASVEQNDHPEYRNKPVIVGAAPDKRGVVSAASYEARKYGVHSAMPSREAAQLCPNGIFLPVNMKRYIEISHIVLDIFERFTPLIEPLSIDEAFLDISGAKHLFGDGPEIAERIKRTIKAETGLTASVGVAVNKFLAKLASDLEKPDGLTVVPESREEIALFLAPLSVGKIWGVGKVTQAILENAGIRTIAQLQARSEKELIPLIGKHSAQHLRALAWGEDSRGIELNRREKSISREYTFDKDCKSEEVLEKLLADLVEDVAQRLRDANRFATIIHLKIRWTGFKTITRQRRLTGACCDDFTLREAALELFKEQALIAPVRLLGFGVTGLQDGRNEQLGLFDEDSLKTSKKEALSRTVDKIREKFGPGIIGRGDSADILKK